MSWLRAICAVLLPTAAFWATFTAAWKRQPKPPLVQKFIETVPAPLPTSLLPR